MKTYVGCNANKAWQVFRSKSTPTRDTHSKLYAAVIGPFRTVQGAQFMAEYGPGNPHCQSVSDAERLARQYAKMSRFDYLETEG